MHKKTCCRFFDVHLACEYDRKEINQFISLNCLKKCILNIKTRYNVGMAAQDHVAEDSTAELPTQHGRPLNIARPVLSSETGIQPGPMFFWDR